MRQKVTDADRQQTHDRDPLAKAMLDAAERLDDPLVLAWVKRMVGQGQQGEAEPAQTLNEKYGI